MPDAVVSPGLEPVAIIGMGVILPGAPTVEQYWHNLVNGVDAITDIPEARRDPLFFNDVGNVGGTPDRTYGRRGGFVAAQLDFDPLAYGIPPSSVNEMEPDQLAVLAVATAAIDDAGGDLGDRSRVGVIIGRGGYLAPGGRRFDQRVRTVRQITKTVQELAPSVGSDVLDQIRAALVEQLGDFAPDETIGLVPNLAASRVANRLDLGGPAYTVDAACASSLIAVDQAMAELGRRRCDVVIAGGVHYSNDELLWSMFTQLGALSPSHRISPLSREADGLLVGEGTGVVVLKRLADARRDGNRVYAIIRGSGTSSDGKGASLFSPAVGGQVRAVRRAWEEAGLDPTVPGALGLLEAHGTATRAGDAAELTTMAEVFGQGQGDAVIGSVKSMIGHTMPAAGIAGLVKATLAVHHATLPPTLHCDEPNPLLAKTRFRVLAEAEDWTDGPTPRRAAVNAFGFGGVNAHVIVEQGDSAPARRARTVVDEPEAVLRLAADSPEELLRLLDEPARGTVDAGSGAFRIGVVGADDKRIAAARKVVSKVAAGGSWPGAGDIWCSFDPLLSRPGAKLAFLFPGLEADSDPKYADVARHFRLNRPRWSVETLADRASSVADLGLLLDTALRRIGVAPDAVAGHSVGEWTAMQAAGMYPRGSTVPLLAKYWPDGFPVPEVDFLLLGCAADQAGALLAAEPELVLSHDNAPRQTIVCGPPAAAARLARQCRDSGIVVRTLPFRSGFHTPLMSPYLGPFEQLVNDIELRKQEVPIWSATTAAPYPHSLDGVRELFLAHLVRPVRFREVVEGMYGSGVRAFVQLGAGQLGSFVGDTLGARSHLMIGASSGLRSGLGQLRRVATALWVEGARPRFDALARRRTALQVATPLLSLPESVHGLFEKNQEPDPQLPGGLSDAITAEFAALRREVRQSALDVAAAMARPTPRQVESTVDVSLTAMPYLRDHRFFQQRPGWPDEADYRPVVPATTLVDVACREVEKLRPGRVAVHVVDAVFTRWLIAEPAKRVPLSICLDGDRANVRIGEFAAMTVVTADDYPAAPAPSINPTRTVPPLLGVDIYELREMFHGPAFRGVIDIGGVTADRIHGQLVVPPAPGALTDNVGQLLGNWLIRNQTDGLLAFPRSINRITWYAREPGPGTRMSCDADVRMPHPDILDMDAEVVHEGRVLIRIEHWQDARFPCNLAEHQVHRFPDRELLSTLLDDGRVSVTDRWPSLATRDLYAGVYLNGTERQSYDACPPPEQRAWLLGRIAVKDAVRVRLAADGIDGIYPAEIHVNDDGRTVSGRHGRQLPPLAVAVDHHGRTATALVHD